MIRTRDDRSMIHPNVIHPGESSVWIHSVWQEPKGYALRRDATTFVHPVSARLRTVASLRDGVALPRRSGLRQVCEKHQRSRFAAGIAGTAKTEGSEPDQGRV